MAGAYSERYQTRGGAKSWLPTPYAFDHCTVQARIGARTIWIDPTITGQGGGIDAITYPDYQVGLVIKPGNDRLTDIPLQDKGRVAVREIINIPAYDGPARLHVVSEYTGSYADDMRAQLRATNRGAKLKDYQQFYADWFGKVRADSLSYSDDIGANKLRIVADFTIRKPWHERNGKRNLDIDPFRMRRYLAAPDDEERTMPFALEYPVRYTEDIEVHLPDDGWSGDPVDDQVDGPGFRLKTTVRILDQKAVYHYSYEATADYVQPEQYERFRKELEAGAAATSWSLSRDDRMARTAPLRDEEPRKKEFKPLSVDDLYPLLYVLLGVAVFATWAIRRNRGK